MKLSASEIDFILDRMIQSPEQDAVVWNNETFTNSDLIERVKYWREQLSVESVPQYSLVAIVGDFSPNCIALFLALIEYNCILVPFNNSTSKETARKSEIAQIEFVYHFDEVDQCTFTRTERKADHQLYSIIRERRTPGLILFSSGTSGEPKAAVHDFAPLLEKFKVKKKEFRTINFLLFDHWGGLNTMLHTLSNGGLVISVKDRSPTSVCRLIEQFEVDLLPATPTFLNLLILDGGFKKYNLSSLKVITYGAEPMPAITLQRLKEVFPRVKLQQTYGLIEVGVLRSKSRSDGSLWVQIGGDDYQTRVVDGILQIKTKSTILGYLNAPLPLSDDGWFITGDVVEQDGDYFRIHGRKSELINVGGEKVYPIEVENVIYEIDNVREATVFGEPNKMIGNIVCARVTLAEAEDQQEFILKLKSHCRQRLAKFKVPVKVEIVKDAHYGNRFKKERAKIGGVACP